jgi:hypothetical protein
LATAIGEETETPSPPNKVKARAIAPATTATVAPSHCFAWRVSRGRREDGESRRNVAWSVPSESTRVAAGVAPSRSAAAAISSPAVR